MNNSMNNVAHPESASDIYEHFLAIISDATNEQLENMQKCLQNEINLRAGKTSAFGMANNPYWNCKD